MTPNEELSFLRSRVVELEQKLTGVNTADIAFMFSLPPMLEKAFKLLLTNQRVTTQMIAENLGADIDAKMTMFRLRKYLTSHGVEVKSKRHLGYWIDPAAKSQLVDALEATLSSK